MGAAEDIQAEIARIADEFSGEISVAATNLRTGEHVEFNSREAFPASSVIKVPILVTLFHRAERGAVHLDRRRTMHEEDRVPGSGVLKLLSGGLTLTVADAAALMIAVSDNTAANLVIDQLGGIAEVNRAMTELGLHSIRLKNRLDFDVIGRDIAHLGVASTNDLDTLAQAIAHRTAFSPAVSEACEKLLSQQQYLDQVLRYVSVAPYAEELRIVQPVVSASKTGFYPGVRNDMGIVRFRGTGFTYAACTRGSDDTLFAPEDEGEVTNGRIGHLLLRHWWPEDAGPAPVADSPYLRRGGGSMRSST